MLNLETGRIVVDLLESIRDLPQNNHFTKHILINVTQIITSLARSGDSGIKDIMFNFLEFANAAKTVDYLGISLIQLWSELSVSQEISSTRSPLISIAQAIASQSQDGSNIPI